MTIQISISGHADNSDAEGNFLDAATEAVRKMRESGEVYSASATTSHHGTVDLVTVADTTDDHESAEQAQLPGVNG